MAEASKWKDDRQGLADQASRSRRESEWNDQAIGRGQSIDPSFPWIWSFRPCPGMCVGVCRNEPRVEPLSYDYGHYLGQTRLSVSTRSRARAGLLDSPKSFPTLENYECSFSRVASLQRARSTRLTVLRPDVDFASALVIQDADSA